MLASRAVSRRVLCFPHPTLLRPPLHVHRPPQLDVFTPLAAHLQRLWTLWEMTLLGRALMVVAPTPGETSTTVAALLALVAPLPYALDFRPYYCIHDTAFARLAAGVMPGPEARDVPSLIGVTNLYFIRVGGHVAEWLTSLHSRVEPGRVGGLHTHPVLNPDGWPRGRVVSAMTQIGLASGG